MHASVAVRISQKKSLNAAELKHKDAGGEATSKSQRSSEDAVAPMGIATTNAELRLMAAVEGMDKVSSEFQPCDDVSFGGVLLALPALTSCCCTSAALHARAAGFRFSKSTVRLIRE